jgi:hypothetical protein
MRIARPLRIAAALCAIIVIIAAAGCSSYRHRQFRAGEATQATTEHYTLHFIEADDEGWLWEPEQATRALELVQQQVERDNTLVVVFVHGWHRSSECCDDAVEGFKETLIRLSQQFERPAHDSVTPQRAATTRGLNVVGIYVGWRGRSLPGFLNYATFWGRKAAAERVGNTDLSEFLSRLNDLYGDFNPRAPSTDDRGTAARRDRFLGLITIGHSFGSQVLLKAVVGTLEERLIHMNPKPGYLGTPLASQAAVTNEPLYGLGDLIVLLNPAAEAALYHRLHLLSRSLAFPRTQAPIMLTISAENDRPRHSLFTFGRVLGEFFTGKPRKSDPLERAAEREALGVFDAHITHRLEPTDPNMSLVAKQIPHAPEPGCPSREPCRCRFLEWERVPEVTAPNSITNDNAGNLTAFDFSASVVFNNVRLQPKSARVLPYQPLIVAAADDSIVDGHSGIFTEPLLDFLVPYIAFVETKHAQLR